MIASACRILFNEFVFKKERFSLEKLFFGNDTLLKIIVGSWSDSHARKK
jgi:hypothetical protein